MAKDFGKAGSAKTFTEVGKESAAKAVVLTIKTIPDENIIDYPKNREDISYTADIENSINEMGFTDPLEVTGFGQPDNIYMILSGHRRRIAGRKCGMTTFPCIVRGFGSDNEVSNYVLLSNSQRDSEKDPLLLCNRYMLHEEYLKSIGFRGGIRDEIAKRLGISAQQADRYNAVNKLIAPIRDMIRDGTVGMSSAFPIATHIPEEQAEIFDMLTECVDAGGELTRKNIKSIVDGYRDGKRSYDEIINQAPERKDNGTPANTSTNTEPSNNGDTIKPDEKREVSEEPDITAVTDDQKDNESAKPVRGQAPNKDYKENNKDSDEADTGNSEDMGADTDNDDVTDNEKKDKPPLETEVEKQIKSAKEISKCLEKLNTIFNNSYDFINSEEAEGTLKNLQSTFLIVIDEMYNISRIHKLKDVFQDALNDIANKLKDY